MYPLKNTFFAANILIALIFSPLFSQSGDDQLVGRWYTEKCKAAFDFFRSGEEYQARLIPFEIPDLIDSHNPVDSLKNRRLSGAITIYGLRYDAKAQRWHDGKVYNPENGKTYSCVCVITTEGTLHFRGFIGVSVLGGSQVWTKGPCDKKPR